MSTLTDSSGSIQEEVFDQGAPSGARHACREFSQKMAVVIRPCAFRLRRLHEVRVAILGPDIFAANSCAIRWLFVDVPSHPAKILSEVLWRSWFDFFL